MTSPIAASRRAVSRRSRRRARIEHRLHLLDDKRHVAAAPEHALIIRVSRRSRRNADILRIDEDLERAPPAVLTMSFRVM
jgi:hypothetical protein